MKSSMVCCISAMSDGAVASCVRVQPGGDGTDAVELGVLRERDAGARLARDIDVAQADVLVGLVPSKRRSRPQAR